MRLDGQRKTCITTATQLPVMDAQAFSTKSVVGGVTGGQLHKSDSRVGDRVTCSSLLAIQSRKIAIARWRPTLKTIHVAQPRDCGEAETLCTDGECRTAHLVQQAACGKWRAWSSFHSKAWPYACREGMNRQKAPKAGFTRLIAACAEVATKGQCLGLHDTHEHGSVGWMFQNKEPKAEETLSSTRKRGTSGCRGPLHWAGGDALRILSVA
ncbi:hypothetical protein BGZ61DRAFT_126922 [Ilyonectria robusta]|uniref:uncharacterized protein n=1 Tax=Ilyonectria robusta TaxID=1079257 RepID=UPI001E8DC249|nr:uncharacterized protein BGZ61DRAFT_126922 [Ilyonectria robusta]KAH8734607.1 hypothetical protein BGZ61DRAFT_126922 [Ilyonectria robusta]